MKIKLHHLNLCTTNVPAMEQIFFYDPDGNIVEVHQVREAGTTR